ncbi:DinB family protein [Bacillus sp. es.034]|uniref:DinB family protein n=1 Tax=Bacillus sp. es.034 TaxID=1761763 RepID=UPI000BF759D1|nr:DinB family protein [Bacillus sp. es.034]PFG05293.1 uncharacterized protein DUF1572 [Bacillus sp. es.034]
MDINQIIINNLVTKFVQIKSRMLSVINQLSNDDINWRPNEESNSISNLVIHIAGNIHQRIEVGICGLPDKRERDEEFNINKIVSKEEAIEIIESHFEILDKTIKNLEYEEYLRPQKVRSNEVTILEVLLQCASHFSEHLGQILYIGKMRLNNEYISTSIPRKK